MEKSEQKQMEARLLRTAILLLLLAGSLIALALTRASETAWRIPLLALAALPALTSFGLFHIVGTAGRARREHRNFFLYDPRTRTNRPLEALNAEEVMDRTLRYMSTFRMGRQFYISRLFDAEGGAPEVFKPLFCYQLLMLLILCDEPERWDAFLSCGKELADAFDCYLAKEEEDTLCQRLQVAVACFPTEGASAFREYLMPRREELTGKIMSYVQRHIQKFG